MCDMRCVAMYYMYVYVLQSDSDDSERAVEMSEQLPALEEKKKDSATDNEVCWVLGF